MNRTQVTILRRRQVPVDGPGRIVVISSDSSDYICHYTALRTENNEKQKFFPQKQANNQGRQHVLPQTADSHRHR